MKTITQQSEDPGTPNTPKTLTRTRTKHTNSNITNQQREELINLILRTNSIRKSAQKMGINDSTAKSIYYKFKNTGKVEKTSKKRKNLKSSGQESSHGTDSRRQEPVQTRLIPAESNSEFVDHSSDSQESKHLNQEAHARSFHMTSAVPLPPTIQARAVFDHRSSSHRQAGGIPLYSQTSVPLSRKIDPQVLQVQMQTEQNLRSSPDQTFYTVSSPNNASLNDQMYKSNQSDGCHDIRHQSTKPVLTSIYQSTQRELRPEVNPPAEVQPVAARPPEVPIAGLMPIIKLAQKVEQRDMQAQEPRQFQATNFCKPELASDGSNNVQFKFRSYTDQIDQLSSRAQLARLISIQSELFQSTAKLLIDVLSKNDGKL